MTQSKQHRRTLALKIIAWSFIPTILILTGVALLTFFAYQQVTEDLVIERDQQVTRLFAGQIANELENYTQILTEVARSVGSRRSTPELQEQALVNEANRLVVFDGGVVVLDNHGMVVAAQEARQDALGKDWSDRDYFRQIIRSQQPAYSDILKDGLQGADVIVAAAPIYGDQGEFLGVLVGMFRTRAASISAFYGGIVKQRIGSSGNFYLVDSSGRVIYHPNAERIGDDFSTQPVVQRLLAGEAGALRTRDIEGRDIVAGYASIPGISWGLVAEEQWATLVSSYPGYGQFLSVLIILGVLIPVGLVAVGVRQITRPIGDLIDAAQQVAQGNFDQTITADSGDEVEELADQFNLMARQLQESYTQLEQRVIDRTRDLEVLYRADEELYRHLNLTQVLEALVSVAVDNLHADKSSILVWEPQISKLVVHAFKGFSSETAGKMSFSTDDGLAGKVIRTGEPAIIEDTWNDPDVSTRITDPEGIRSFMHVPIKVNGRIFGIFNVAYIKPRAFGESEQRLFVALAQRVSLAIENAQLYEQARLVAAVEERQRLARELHDAVTQSLFSASLIAEVLTRLWDKNPEEGRRRLEELRQLTRGSLAEMRTLLLELRPAALMEAEVHELFHHLCDAFSGRTMVSVNCDVKVECDLLADVKVALYRIAQEALNNIAKHSQASQVEMSLICKAGGAVMEIRDNGRGFEIASVPADHLGLNIMRERADSINAQLTLNTEPGEGTRVRVVWGVGDEEKSEAVDQDERSVRQ